MPSPHLAEADAAFATDMLDRFAGKEGPNRDALTAKHPVGRLGRGAEEIAAAVLYLRSDAANFTTGPSLKVDGGWLAL